MLDILSQDRQIIHGRERAGRLYTAARYTNTRRQ